MRQYAQGKSALFWPSRETAFIPGQQRKEGKLAEAVPYLLLARSRHVLAAARGDHPFVCSYSERNATEALRRGL